MSSESDNLEALYRLAYKEFDESGRNGNSRRRELSDELASTIKDLFAVDRAGPAGFISPAAEAYRAAGKTEISERIAKYLGVALREQAPELLSPPWTERFRAEVENSIEVRCLILEQDIEKYLNLPRWHGCRPPPRPSEDYLKHEYILLRSDLKAELHGRLETLQLRGTAEKRKTRTSEMPQCLGVAAPDGQSAAAKPSLQHNDQAREANSMIMEHATEPDEPVPLADERTEAFTEQDDRGAVAKTVGDSPDPEDVQRAKIRSDWLNQRLDRYPEWTSDTDIAANGGPTYNATQRYRSGASSTRDRYVRGLLAKAFRCNIDEVPE